MRIRGLLAALALVGGVAEAQDCAPVDYLTLPLVAGGDPVEVALETAYPGLDLDRAAGRIVFADGAQVPYAPPRRIEPAGRLNDATVGDMFVYVYPLAFDLTPRRTPFEDPGRLRNDAFFRALYFDTKAEVRASLDRVSYSGTQVTAAFLATEKHCVDVQLDAALTEIEALGTGFERYLDSAGGSFNWRNIADTNRLSVHSFGIAVDFNSQLGGYWRWSGAAQGQAFEFNNNFPPEVVQAMERRGFIWGGKWHHFDGMHFEFRPELILYARLVGRG